LISRATTLDQLERHDDAQSVYDEIFTRYKDIPDQEMRRIVFAAMVNKIAVFTEAKDYKRALEYADTVIDHANSDPSTYSTMAITALSNKAQALVASKREAEALLVLEDTLKRYADSSDTLVRNLLIEVQFSRAVTLGWVGRAPEARSIFATIVEKHASSTDECVQQMVTKAREYEKTDPSQWTYCDLSWPDF
jgi:tetratricopeptide (TPR) repeat protein